MLDRKQIRVIFLFEFKMSCKAAEITPNINNAFAFGLNVQYSGGSRSFAKETRALKMRKCSDGPSEVDNNQLRGSLKLILLMATGEVAEELNIDHCTIIQHLKQIRKVKNLSGCLMSWPPPKKIVIWKRHLFLFCARTAKHLLIRLWPATKSRFYTTPGNNQLSGWSEKKLQSTSQSQICTNIGHRHCLVVCCPSDPLQLSESQWNHYIWEVCSKNWWDALKTATPCSRHWSTERAQFSMTAPDDCMLHNQHLKKNWTTRFCLIHHIHLTSHQPTITSSSISTTFCRENASTNSRRQKMLYKSSLNSKAWIFMLQE